MSGSIARRHVLALCISASTARHARARDYPDRPLRIVVPYQPGGPSDVLARTFADHLAQRFDQTVLVENKVGASGILGTDAVAKAAPDGRTLLVTLGSSILANPFLYRTLPYDPQKELALVSQLAAAPIILNVHPSLPVDTVPGFLAYAAARRGTLAFGSYGVGSHGHLACAQIDRAVGGGMVHVAYKGEAAMLHDLVSGQVQWAFASALSARPHADAGRLRMIGIVGPQRLGGLPAVPTLAEQGLLDEVFQVVGIIGMAAPAGTPQHILDKLATQVQDIGRQPVVRARMEALGLHAVVEGPAAFKATYQHSLPIWRKMVQDSGARLD
jgi:tripartite-type tricarboxylate transporter receptor subunit TctC